MKKLIVAALFTMFASAGAAASGASSSAGSSPEPGGEPPMNEWCAAVYAACTADCMDMVGNAKGACLRACRADYNECLGN